MDADFGLRRPFDLKLFEHLAPAWQGRIFYFPEIGSTNLEARRRLRQHPARPQEIALVADRQTAGRGRLGRSWEAPAGSGLLCTLAFPLAPLGLDRAYLYTASLALSVLKAVTELQPELENAIRLKWPNDLLRGGKKVGGILAELENNLGQNANESWLILGFGLNISLSERDFEEAGISARATNLTPHPVAREPLLVAILAHFEAYRARLKTDAAEVQREWAANLVTIGQEVQVLNNGGQRQLTGLAVGVTEDGALVVREANGFEHSVQAGDVSIRLPDGSYSA